MNHQENISQRETAELSAFTNFVELVADQDLNKMLSEALSLLIRSLEADAGALLFAGQTKVRVRQGPLAEPAEARIRQWEEAVIRQVDKQRQWIHLPPAIPFTLHSLPVSRGGAEKLKLLNAPLSSQARVSGTITLVCPPDYELSPSGHRLLSYLSHGIGNLAELIDNLSLTQQRLSQLSLFYQLGQALVSTFDLSQLLQDTMALAASVINAAASSLLLVDEKRQELVFAAAYGSKGALLRRQRISMNVGIAGWVARHGEPMIVHDVSKDSRFNPEVDVRTGFLTRSILAVPMQLRGETIGVLEVLNKEEGFDEEDLRVLLTLAAEAAIAIENARLIRSLREERDRILSAQEEVRRELNRKLHDGTVQFLAAIAMGIDHVERLLELKPDAVYAELEALRELTRQAMRESRMLLFELRPVVLESQGLVPALRRYVEQLRKSETFHVHLDDGGFDAPLGPQVARTIFAIVQEAVNNTRKHAKARNLWIRMGTSNDDLMVQVEDDGLGFDVGTIDQDYEEGSSFGLLNMRERAALIEGELSIESSEVMPDQGTIVTLRMPLSLAMANEQLQNPEIAEL
ncbi:MAG: sensor histidine kinase [Anaerolineae bacterium]|nr:MAG: sensor histidine kinase [Anaerolineae bacterium]